MATRDKQQGGNILFIILIAIVLVALLTQMVSQSSEQQSDILTQQTSDDEINRLFTQAATLQAAIEQMVVRGDEPSTLYTNLSTLKPGDAGYETAPHAMKIYHPLGGGVSYLSGSKPGSSAAATAFKINKDAIVTGVGATDAVVGDILFTAVIAAAETCARINKLLTGSSSIPVLATADFDDLFTNGVAVTIAGGNCADCVNVPRICVTNAGGTAWGYYAALFPG